MREGSFDITVAGVRRRLRAGSVFITHPGLVFHCRHTECHPTDVCLSIGFEPDAVAGAERLWEAAGWAARESPTPRLAYVDRRLALAADRAEGFEMERWALAALTALEVDGDAPRARGHYGIRTGDVDAVVAACRAIEDDPAARRSIADRARHVGLASTALTRSFRRYAGASPHAYVIRWRLAHAAELLDAGASVSESCYRSGFENLSHFCRAFQRTFGARASAWRRLALRERRRKVQDLRRGPV